MPSKPMSNTFSMYLISTAPYLFSSVPSVPRNIREAGRTEESNEEERA